MDDELGLYCSRFTGIGCEDNNENEQARKKNVTLIQNSFWMEPTVLEIEQQNPGRGPEGQKGQALAVGRECMDEHEGDC